MKVILLIVTVFFIFSFLFSEFSDPELFFDQEVVLFGENSIALTGDEVHFAYFIEGVLYYSIFSNLGTEPQTLQVSTQEFYEPDCPSICILDNGKVLIMYADQVTGKLYQALKLPEETNFEITELNDSVYNSPKILKNENELLIVEENGLVRNLNQYLCFSQNEMYETNDVAYFSGFDDVIGRVHSNSEINLRDVNGWPQFNYSVTTADEFLWYNGNPDWENVFMAGYAENMDSLEVSIDIRSEAFYPFGSAPDPNHDIIFVKIAGNSFESRNCDFIYPVEADTFWVYGENYPFPPHNPDFMDPIGYNRLFVPDTMWTAGPNGTLSEGAIFCPHELWIEGTIGGRQTWGCADTVFITGDILYQETPPGNSTDGYDVDGEYIGGENEADYFSLISEKQIRIKYAHWDPWLNVNQKPNCEDGGIYLYGNYISLEEGNNAYEDGLFSFEYQHPHPSTEPITYEDSLYENIDLHRYFLEDEFSNSTWPGNVDYPWYNPIWPEENPTYERGNIYLWGSMYQRRRGFVRRSGSDPHNHEAGVWEIDNHLYGDCHLPSGYGKQYTPDRRKYFPESYLTYTSGILGFKILASQDEEYMEVYEDNDSLFIPIEKGPQMISDKWGNQSIFYNRAKGDEIVFLDNDINEYDIHDYGYDLEMNDFMIDSNSTVFFKSQDQIFSVISSIRSDTINVELELDGPYVSDFARDSNGNVYLTYIDLQEEMLNIEGLTNPDINYEFEQDYYFDVYANPSQLKMVSIFDEADSLLILYIRESGSEIFASRNTYFWSAGSLEGITPSNDQNQPSNEFQVQIYPNPMTQNDNRDTQTKIKYNLPEDDHISITIFNLKGQKVKTLINESQQKGNYEITWNGEDELNKKVSSGVYFYKIDTNKNKMIKEDFGVKIVTFEMVERSESFQMVN